MNYEEALEYIASRSGYDRGFVQNPFAGDEGAARGLRRTRAVLAELGDPQEQLRMVHVAGTKGKGSTSITVASLAQAAGWTTGLYSTPHLHSFRERIQLGLEPIGEGDFAALVGRGARAVALAEQAHPELGGVTAFELVTALALRAFADAQVDVAVIEVGLGGRLDATNVIVPAVAAITAVSLDHTVILGDTLEQIAYEKAGIIKPRKPVAVGPQPPEVTAVIADIAAARHSPLYRAGLSWRTSGDWRAACFEGPWGAFEDFELALVGQHQVENAGIALMAAWLINPRLLEDESRVLSALGAVRWPARFEVAGMRPTVIVDGAHNVESVERIVATIRTLFPERRLDVVLGTSRDKDADGMLAALAPITQRLLAVQSANPRARDAHELASMARSLGVDVQEFKLVADAVSAARAQAGPDGVVLVTGSLYLAAEAREALGLAHTDEIEQRLLYG